MQGRHWLWRWVISLIVSNHQVVYPTPTPTLGLTGLVACILCATILAPLSSLSCWLIRLLTVNSCRFFCFCTSKFPRPSACYIPTWARSLVSVFIPFCHVVDWFILTTDCIGEQRTARQLLHGHVQLSQFSGHHNLFRLSTWVIRLSTWILTYLLLKKGFSYSTDDSKVMVFNCRKSSYISSMPIFWAI